MKRLGSSIPPYPADPGPRSFDTSEYTDPARYAQELDAILRRSWIAVCHVDQLAEENSYVTWDRFGEAVVVSSTADGYHAFHNVCRHRGMRLLDGSGVQGRGRVTCRWHSWTYRMSGELLSVTEPDTFVEGEPWCDAPPPSIAVDTYAGFVWINLGGDSVGLREYLGEVATDLDTCAIAEYKLHDRATVELPVNWKCAIDSFLEAYHVRYLHRDSVGTSLETPGVRYHLMDPHSLLVQPFAKGFADESELDDVDAFKVADNQYLAFPATTIDMVGGHALIVTYLPLAIDRTQLEIWQVYLDKPGAAEKQEKYLRHFLDIVEEDLEVLRALGSVTQSSAYTRNHLNQKECRISHFHRQVDRALGLEG